MNITWSVTVVGCHYHAGVAGVKVGMELVLVREPLNQHDKNAVRVQTQSGVSLGHLSRSDAYRLTPILDGGATVSANVISVSQKPARFNAHVVFDDLGLLRKDGQ
jgi:SWI/SNF-related matrix-associated actin-dependent regulator of chromatin subfamily A3